MCLDNKKARELQLISPFSVEDGRVLSIREQLDAQMEAFYLTGDEDFSKRPIVVLEDASVLNIPKLGTTPLILRRSIIKHIYKRHSEDGQIPLSLSEITEKLTQLSSELLDYVVAYDDPYNAEKTCIVLDVLSRGGNHLIVIIKVGDELSHIEVSNIVSVHGRRNVLVHIEKALRLGRSVYKTDKTDAWLESVRRKPHETSPGINLSV